MCVCLFPVVQMSLCPLNDVGSDWSHQVFIAYHSFPFVIFDNHSFFARSRYHSLCYCFTLYFVVCISFQLLFTCFPMFQFLLFIWPYEIFSFDDDNLH